MHLIVRYVRPYFKRMGLGLTIKLLGTVMDLLLPYILAHIIDDITPLQDMGLVVRWGLVMLACSFLAIAGNVIANRMAAWVARETTRRLRHDLFRKISYLSNRQIDGFTVPSLISRMTTDTYNIHRMVGMMQRIGIRAPILVVGGVAVTITLDPVLALVLTCMLPVILCIVYLVSRRSIPLFDGLQRSVDKMVRVVRENASGVRVIKALSRSEGEKERFEGVNRQVMRDENRANMVMAFSKPAMNLTLNLGLVLVVLVGAHRVNSGLCGPGVITAFLTYFTIILNAMMSVTRVLTMWSKALASAERIETVLAAPDELTVQTLPARDETAHIVFENVNFSYNHKENNLEGINFTLNRGESLGIIGPTGSGKSTLAGLLMRFYDVDSGAVCIDGRDIRGLTRSSLRHAYTMVLQDTWLFNGTVFENIAYGKPGATMEEVVRAAKAARIHSYISRLPEGYHTVLSDNGTSISKGQKQLLTIARAMLLDANMLILDEATSNVDTRTEQQIQAAMRELMKGKTCFVIAHRLSTIRSANHILVMRGGQVVEQGTHNSLMEANGFYRELYQAQFESV